MNRRILALLAGGAAASFALALPLSARPPGTTTNDPAEQRVTTACTGGELTVFGPASMWPPNHKYNTSLYVLAVDNTVDDDPTTAEGNVEVESHGYHDQYVDGTEEDTREEMNGSGTPNEKAGDDITVNEAETDALTVDPGENEAGDPEIVAVETGTGTVQTLWKARAERSGQDPTGRIYTLSATATWSDGSTCTHTIEMLVPHDMRKSTRS